MINKLISQIVSNHFYVGATVQVVAPGTCEGCPFEYKTREPSTEIWNDPSEAHYKCELLNKEIWGENPECEPKLTEMLRNYLSAQHTLTPDGAYLCGKCGLMSRTTICENCGHAYNRPASNTAVETVEKVTFQK